MALAIAKMLSCLLLVVVALAVESSGANVTALRGDPENKCVYTLYVRTGSIWKGGTNSVIGVTFLGSDGVGIRITNLETWGGLMGAGHDYFERRNLDIFSGRGPCMARPPCWMNLTSDGTGPHHGWYCNYVEVTTTGPHMGCSQKLFTVEQWIARDASPYQLYAVRDECRKKGPAAAGGLEQSQSDEADVLPGEVAVTTL